MIDIQFNHSAGNLMHSMGITKQDFDLAKTKVLFYSLSRPFMVQDLYGINPLDEDEVRHNVPIELRTGSGVLERCLQNAITETEKLAMLIMFHEQHKTANEMMSMYLAYSDFGKVEEMIKAKFGTGMKSIIALSIFKSRVNHMSELKEIFECVKAANGSFDIFKSIIPDGQDAIEFLTTKLQGILANIEKEKESDGNIDEDDD